MPRINVRGNRETSWIGDRYVGLYAADTRNIFSRSWRKERRTIGGRYPYRNFYFKTQVEAGDTLDIHNNADDRFRLCPSPLREKREWRAPCKLFVPKNLLKHTRFGVRTALPMCRRRVG